MEPTDEARAEAKAHPGGWVYAIDGKFGPNDAVPPDTIKGAWAVDANGEIVDDFVPNPNYRPTRSPPATIRGMVADDEKPDRLLVIGGVILLAMMAYWVLTWFVPRWWLPF